MCPKCRTAMIIVEFQGVEVDCCTQCGGSWLDAGELAWIAMAAGVPAGHISSALGNVQASGKTNWRCPRCNKRLEAVNLEGPPPVELDRCPRGDGLWFDAGEIPAVVRAFSDGEEGQVAQLLAELHRTDISTHAKGE